MDDLLRFVLVRAPGQVDPSTLAALEPSFATGHPSREELAAKAQTYARSAEFVTDPSTLATGTVALLLVASERSTGVLTQGAVSKIVKSSTGSSLSSFIASQDFKDDRRRLTDSVVALKVLSGRAPANGGDLSDALKGLIIASRAAAAADASAALASPRLTFGIPEPPPPTSTQDDVAPEEGPTAEERAEAEQLSIRAAITALGRLMEHKGSSAPAPPEINVDPDHRLEFVESPLDISRAWHATEGQISELPEGVLTALDKHGVSLSLSSLPSAIDQLESAERNVGWDA